MNQAKSASIIRRLAVFGTAIGLTFAGAVASAPAADARVNNCTAIAGAFAHNWAQTNNVGACASVGVRGYFRNPVGATVATGTDWQPTIARVQASLNLHSAWHGGSFQG